MKDYVHLMKLLLFEIILKMFFPFAFLPSTLSLSLRLASVMDFTLNVAGPDGESYDIEEEVMKKCAELCAISSTAISWISYGTPAADAHARVEKFMPFQVTKEVMDAAKSDAISS